MQYCALPNVSVKSFLLHINLFSLCELIILCVSSLLHFCVRFVDLMEIIAHDFKLNCKKTALNCCITNVIRHVLPVHRSYKDIVATRRCTRLHATGARLL